MIGPGVRVEASRRLPSVSIGMDPPPPEGFGETKGEDKLFLEIIFSMAFFSVSNWDF